MEPVITAAIVLDVIFVTAFVLNILWFGRYVILSYIRVKKYKLINNDSSNRRQKAFNKSSKEVQKVEQKELQKVEKVYTL